MDNLFILDVYEFRKFKQVVIKKDAITLSTIDLIATLRIK
jgi:hypothetical protein